MGTQGTGRKRSTKKERSTAEDDALNLIAREAEARLAAKRAARAEAREIRMRELERQQKELSDDDERMSVGSRGSVRVDDRDYLEKGSRAASALTAGTLTSLGGTSSRRGSGETSLTVDAETSIREIKDALAEVEEKYRKAMVSNAQLDNEKNNLMYQVDTLKDSLMELEELLSESRRGYEDKVKELEREKHGHSVLQFQFNELKETLKQSEELLNEIRQLRMKQEGFVREVSDLQETVEWKDKKIAALERQKEYTDAIRVERDELREEVVKLKDILKKHGIVLGPDLNVNGDVGGTDVNASLGADSASQSTPDSQTPPTEGNSVLGNTEETQLGSKGEEDLDPEQPQDVFEESKDNELSSDGVSRLETPDDHDPAEEQQQLSLSSNEDHVDKNILSKDSNVDIIDGKVVEANSVVMCSPRPEEDETNLEENIPKTTETESKNNSVDIGESVDNNVPKDQDRRPDVVEECSQQKVAQDESVPIVSNTECQQEPGNVGEAENEDGEEVSGKSQPQAGAAGKKKRRKKKGKKKGGTQDEKNQEKGETDSKGKESTSRDDGRPLKPGVDGSVQEPKVENDRESLEVAEAEAVKPSETSPRSEAVKESRMDQVPDDQDKEPGSELVHVEHRAPASTGPFSDTETRQEVEPDPVMFEENEEKSLETVETEVVAETCSHVEALEESTTDPKQEQEDKGPSLETVETITETSEVQTLEESTTESKNDQQSDPQSLETVETEVVAETCSHVEALEESTSDPKNDLQDGNQSLETAETITETSAVQTLESTTDSKQDQEDEGPSLETVETITETSAVLSLEEPTTESKNDQQGDLQSLETVETEVVAETCSHVETRESTTDLREDQEDQEPSLDTVETITVQTLEESRTEDVEESLEAEKAVESVESGSSPPDFSLTSLDLNDVSKGAENPGGVDTVNTSCVDDSGDETNHENTLETSIEEAQGQRSDDSGPEPSGSTDCSETKENLLTSPASTDGVQHSAELNLEAAQTEELDVDSREPAGLIEPCCSLTKPVDELDPEQSPETDQQPKEDQAEESPVELCPETEEMDLLDSPKSPEEAATVESSAERDPGAEESAVESSAERDPGAEESAVESSAGQDPGAEESAVESSAEPDPGAEGSAVESSAGQDPGAEESAVSAEPELKNTQNHQHEPKDEESEANDSSQPCLDDEDEENDEDEEGQSFDFDDMDVEEAVSNQTNPAQQEEVEEGVEVTESRENTRDNDENSEEKRPVDGELVDEESEDVNHEKTTPDEEEVVVVVAEEPAAAELDGVGTDPVNQAVAPAPPVEEGLDAVQHELQDEDSAAPKSSDQASRNKEAPPPSRKDVKKNSKKGKAKGKEECKMS